MRKRPRRIEPGGTYHAGSRGSNRTRIYLDAVDHDLWAGLFARVVRRHGWIVLSYTQMPNHFHVVVRVPDLSLSAGMQELNYSYSRRSNARHGRCAHLFENRFWSELIETREQLLAAIGYIDINSYKSTLRAHPRDWKYGSHGAVAGYRPAPSFLARREVLQLFSCDDRKAVALYRAFVEDAVARVDRSRSQATVTEL
jgi:REP element-mobilizing transposase RayT